MNGEFTAPAPPGAETVEYASFARRLGAALLDSLVWIIGIGFFFPGSAFENNEAAAAIAGLVIASAWFNYFAICEWRWGQTIGKNAVGIRVLPLEGGTMSWQGAALRNLLRLVDLPLTLIGVDYLIVRGSPRRQRLGDKAAKTIVVREAPAEADAPSAAAAPPAGNLPAPTPPAGASPTAAELFGDAAEELARQPGAGSAPSQSPPAPDPGPPGVEEAPAAPGPPALQAAAVSGFPYANWDVRRTILGLLTGLLLGAVFAPLLVLPFDTDLSSSGALLAAQGLLEFTLIAVAIGVAQGADEPTAIGPDLSRLGLRRFRPSGFGWMFLAMFAYYAITIAYGLLVVEPNQEDIARDLGLDQGVATAIAAVVLIAVVAPIAEEIFFRGMLFGGLRRRLSRVPAALISSAVFGALHATTGLTAVPPLILFGFVLALLYERTGSLVPGIVAHMLNNSLALLAAS